MADRYFDRNGATAGFGTLTGNWDTTSANWSTSAAGTATPATFTFTNADAAFFGSSSGTSTAGTATIQNGVTVNLNRLVINTAGSQTIAGTGTGNLTFSGVNPTIASQGSGQPNISAPINFASGLTFQPGTSALVLSGIGQAGNSGTVNISDGTLYCLTSGSGTPDQIKGATALALTQSSVYTSIQYYGAVAYTEPAAISAVFASDPGQVNIVSQNNAGVTLSHGSVGTYTGSFQATASLTTSLTARLVLNTAPALAGVLYFSTYSLTTGQTGIAPVIAFNHNAIATIGAVVYLYVGQAATALAAANLCLEQNSAATTTFSGNVLSQTGSNASAFLWLRLTGTGTSVLSGNYAPTLGTNGLRKLGTGQWTLSGNNTYTGSTLLEAGTLVATSSTALGAATSSGSSISGSGVLQLSGGISLNKSGTDISLTTTNNPVQSLGGTNTLRSKQLSLASSATTTFNVATGNKLVLQTEGGGVIVGTSASLTKSGDGELELPASANTYTGTVTVSAGTLTVGSVANSGAAAAWGQGSTAVDVFTTLRYNGSGGSTTRSVRMNGTGTPTIDASGSGALVLNSVTQDTNAKTMVLRGTNTDDNKVVSSIANNLGVVSLAKEDAGRWLLVGGFAHTGTTAVNGGTLRVEAGNSNTASGAVTIGASGTVELVTDTLASANILNGKVLGTGNVTVNGGTIKTRGGATQKGQVRYGGNLTFGTGSTLYIGAAA